MAVKRATLEIESTGQAAHYETEGTLGTESVGPVLVVEVEDFEEALELVETLNRSRAQKKRAPKLPASAAGSTQPPASNGDGARADGPKPGELPPKCETPECANEGTYETEEGRFCSTHYSVAPSIRREWHAAFVKAQQVTPAPEGAKKSRGIRKQIEGAA